MDVADFPTPKAIHTNAHIGLLCLKETSVVETKGGLDGTIAC
jgi:hypothetical protein